MHRNHHILKLYLSGCHQNIAMNAYEFHVLIKHHVLQPREQVVVHENQTFLYQIKNYHKVKIYLLKIILKIKRTCTPISY